MSGPAIFVIFLVIVGFMIYGSEPADTFKMIAALAAVGIGAAYVIKGFFDSQN